MSLYDFRTKEQWQRTLDDVCQELGMPTSILNEQNKILQVSGERNPLCSTIRSIEESSTFICGQTQQFMAEKARVTQRSVIDACEAGMSKFVIPLFFKGKFVGSLTACGSSIPSEEIDLFIIAKSTRMSEEEVAQLTKHVSECDPVIVTETVNRLFQEIQGGFIRSG